MEEIHFCTILFLLKDRDMTKRRNNVSLRTELIKRNDQFGKEHFQIKCTLKTPQKRHILGCIDDEII